MSSLKHSLGAAPSSAALRSFEAQWLAREADPLSALREKAMQRFLRLGLPSTRDESWRYTNLRHLASRSFIDAPRASAELPNPAAARSLLGPEQALATLYMVNGYPVLPSPVYPSINGLEISSLRQLCQSDPEILSRSLEPLSDAEEARWGLLNKALFVDGLYLKVTSRLASPLLIVHLTAARSADEVAYPRVIIEVSRGSSATVIEHHVRQAEETALCNSATHIALKRDAEIEHYRVFSTGPKSTHVDTLELRQESGSRCRQFTVAVGGGLVRATLDAHLNEPRASLDSYALLVGHEDRHVDCVNIATHGAPETISHQTARAIASGTSRVIFNSKVVVCAGAVRAESQQSCRALLLSPSAEIDSRPQLEIHTDEVKCAHGATTGRLDPDMLFYMLSRGLDRETAQSLLIYAFLADVLTGMSVSSARAAIEDALISQLPDSQVLQKFR
jgi:Fe-S cluster assembly protein SufD